MRGGEWDENFAFGLRLRIEMRVEDEDESSVLLERRKWLLVEGKRRGMGSERRHGEYEKENTSYVPLADMITAAGLKEM